MTSTQPELLPDGDLTPENGQARPRGEKMTIAARLGISRRTVNYWEERATALGDPVPWDTPSDLPSWYGRAHQGRSLPRKIMSALLGAAPAGPLNARRASGDGAPGQNSRAFSSVVGRGESAADVGGGESPAVEDSLVTLHTLLVGEMNHLKKLLENREDALAVRSGREDLLKLADKLRQVSKGVQADMVAAGKYVEKYAVKDHVQGLLLEYRRQVRAVFRKARASLLGTASQHEWDEAVERAAEDAERVLLDSPSVP